MQLVRKIEVDNQYSGNGWNFEKTTKYIFAMEDFQLEAGYFEHYRDDVFVKAVVELPVSYGCPAHCKFCATSAIEAFRPLESACMKAIMDYIWTEKQLDNREYVLLSITGTGDISFNFEHTLQFLDMLKNYTNLHVTVSSCLWNKEKLQRIEELSNHISIRNVQITSVSLGEKKLGEMIPVYKQKKSYFDEIVEYIRGSKQKYYRFNYIMMRGINDSEKAFYEFCEKIKPVKEKSVVRIAKLNETVATVRNGILPSEMDKMEKFQRQLECTGIRSYLFYAYKNDHMNCGQLITEDGIERK